MRLLMIHSHTHSLDTIGMKVMLNPPYTFDTLLLLTCCLYHPVVGSTYLGGFLNGLWHISDGNTIGIWVSTLETKYEGTFLYGLKHGRGKQSFLDGSYYEGEFAKGYEHGSGRIVYPDGNVFTGKFRFGRRDGPGELVTRDRVVMEKGVFRDSGMPFTDVYPPFVEELSKSDVATIVSAGKTSLFDPESLLNLCFKAISQNLKEPRLLGNIPACV